MFPIRFDPAAHGASESDAVDYEAFVGVLREKAQRLPFSNPSILARDFVEAATEHPAGFDVWTRSGPHTVVFRAEANPAKGETHTSGPTELSEFERNEQAARQRIVDNMNRRDSIRADRRIG